MSTLVSLLKAFAAIPKLLDLVLKAFEAWRKTSSITREQEKNNRNDAAIDALAGVHDENGFHSGVIEGSGSEDNGSKSPTGS